ncbi:GNAT family N-acetyltransferase [Dokdonella sp.]|uniref:GNAT family N-acetyltransferase n=1 Tax=Dokdonella sp. TaxID=2291710 RepID=UPI003527A384
MNSRILVNELREDEFDALGALMVEVYAGLPGFPGKAEQPRYYEMLANIGSFNEKAGVQVLVAHSQKSELQGGVVYFSDMAQYGSGGTATAERNAAGIRLLAVSPRFRGQGVGKALTLACIERATGAGMSQVILHTTDAMKTAWTLYEGLGFARSRDLDFNQEGLPVYGFRLPLM